MCLISHVQCTMLECVSCLISHVQCAMLECVPWCQCPLELCVFEDGCVRGLGMFCERIATIYRGHVYVPPHFPPRGSWRDHLFTL